LQRLVAESDKEIMIRQAEKVKTLDVVILKLKRLYMCFNFMCVLRSRLQTVG
jgi:hypothetical protein